MCTLYECGIGWRVHQLSLKQWIWGFGRSLAKLWVYITYVVCYLFVQFSYKLLSRSYVEGHQSHHEQQEKDQSQ